MSVVDADVVVVGSGAGGGTVAQELAPLARAGLRVLVLEKGPRLRDHELVGGELALAPLLYEDSGGFLTADGSMTLAFGTGYGGSTVVYTGTSLIAPRRVVDGWGVPGLSFSDVEARSRGYAEENNVHLQPEELLNDNNRLFRDGARAAGYEPRQFPINVKGCKGSSLCNLGCPNGAKQGTNRVQLPRAEAAGVEVVTRADVRVLEEDRTLAVTVSPRPEGGKGLESSWPPGEYRVRARAVVVAAGSVGTPALLLRSGLGALVPRLGEAFTCHPAQILVAEHPHDITNDVGHPKSFYVDRAEEEGFVLESCMYFPFTTAKNLTGFGTPHRALMRAFSRLQMILVLACDRRTRGNRVAIDRDGRPVVHYRFTDEVVRSIARANRAAARIFFAAGALRVHAPTADPPLLERAESAHLLDRVDERHFRPGKTSVSAAHLMGGCAMGRDRSDSVTDAWGRVHGVPWLYVADASLFPDALQINPYLTIMALAGRVADRVKEELAHLSPRAA